MNTEQKFSVAAAEVIRAMRQASVYGPAAVSSIARVPDARAALDAVLDELGHQGTRHATDYGRAMLIICDRETAFGTLRRIRQQWRFDDPVSPLQSSPAAPRPNFYKLDNCQDN